MKSKKLISLLCAAALTVSSFAGLATTASAATEEDILWSDTFDGSATTGIFLTGQDSGPNTNSDIVEGLTFVTTNRGGGDCGIYTDANGTTVYGGSYYAVLEKEDASDKYLRLSVPVFGDYEDTTKGRWGHVDFTDGALTATAEKDVVMDFDIKMTDGKVHGVTEGKENVTNPVLRVGTFDANVATAVKIDKDALSIGDDWVHARIIVSDSTGATLYIEGVEASTNPSVKSIASLGLYSSDGLSSAPAMFDLIAGGFTPDDGGSYTDADLPSYTPVIDLDNVIVYNEAAGVATADSKAPGAQTSTGGATPVPTEAPTVIEAAPSLTAPEGVDNLESYNFDDNATAMWTLGTEERNITDVPGLTVHIGARASGGATDTYAAVTEIATGNVLQMQAGRFSTVARAPRMSVDTSMPVADGASTVMAFNVRLSAAKGHGDDAQPRLYFIKNTDQQGSDGQGAYRNVAAVLTAVEGDEIYRGDDTGSDKISAYITPDEWHTVVFIVSPTDSGATHRLYIDGAEDPAVKCDYVATGENATTMDNLPILTPESKASKVGGVDTTPNFGLVTIDNLLAYQGVASEPRRLLPTTGEAPTPAPTEVPLPEVEMTLDADTKVVSMTSDMDATAYLVQASYDTEGALVAVKAAKEVSLKAAEAVTETLETLTVGDKIMLWNNLKDITPIADAIVAAAGDAQATPVPTPEPTEVPTEAPTATPEVTETTTPTDTPVEPTEAPTPTPVPTEAPTPTPAPVSAVTVTQPEGATLAVMNGETEVATGTEVAAGTVLTVNASGVAAGYAATISVTKADDAETVVTVTNGKFTMPEYPVTITATVAWEGKFTVAADATYVNFQEATADTNYVGQTPVMIGYVTCKNGELTPAGLDYADTATAMVFSVDASEYAYKIESAKLKFNATTQGGNNTYFRFFGTYANYIDFDTVGESGITANNLATLGGTASQVFDTGNNSWTYGTVKNQTTPIEIDITDTVKSDADGKLTMWLATGTGRITEVADLVIELTTTKEESYHIVNVTTPDAADGTLAVDQKLPTVGSTVTVTAAAATGKKVTGVTVVPVNAESTTTVEVTAGENGTYTFTMPSEDVTVAATYDRADIATIEVTGAGTASTGSIETYTAVAKAADGTVLTPKEGEIVWTVDGVSENTTIVGGVLTVAADEAEYPATKTATVKATAGSVEGTVTVTIVDLPTYAITAATELTGGSVATDVNASIEGGKVVVTPTALAGYAVSKVTYQDVPAAPEAVALKYNAEQVENGRDKDETDTYTFVEGADAAAKALFADATDATKVDATYTTKAEDYIGTNDGNKGLPTVNVTAAAGTYKLYYLGYNNDTTPITATIGDQTVSFGAGVNFAAGVTSPERVLKIYTADLVLAEAVTDATLTLGTSAAAAWLPDLYAVAMTGTPNATAPTVTEVTATEGVYSFEMPAYPVVVSAEFAKVDLAITNATTDTNGTITVAEKAKLGDTVEITVTPNGGYELATLTFKGTAEGSTVAETAITAKDGVYSFTMPSEAVTVTATFALLPLADRLPAADYDAATLQSVAVNAGQTLREDNQKSYAVWAAQRYNIDGDLQSNDKHVVTAQFDIKLAGAVGETAAESFTMKANNNANLGPTIYFYTADAASFATKSSGKEYNVALVADKWYNIKIYATINPAITGAAGTTSGFTIEAYEIDENDAISSTAVFTDSSIAARNCDKKVWNNLTVESIVGSPKVDNFYYYTDAKYTSTVTVTDGTNPVPGVTVSLNDMNASTTTTNNEGKATFNTVPGTYTVTVDKAFYAAPADPVSLVVAKDGANAANVTMTAAAVTDVTFTSNAAEFTVEVKEGETVVAPKEEGGKVYTLEQGLTYTYTVTPTGTAANSYDPKTDTVTVGSDATQTVNVELAAKTYAVTFTGLPAYAKVSYTVGTEEAVDVYSDATGAVAAIEGIGAGETFTYSVTKGGYTSLSNVELGAVNEDKAVQVTMAYSDANTLLYEDFDNSNDTSNFAWGVPSFDGTAKIANGALAFVANHSSNGRGTVMTLNPATTDGKYTMSYKLKFAAPVNNGSGNESGEFTIADANNNVILGFMRGAVNKDTNHDFYAFTGTTIDTGVNNVDYDKVAALTEGTNRKTIAAADFDSTASAVKDLTITATVDPTAGTVTFTVNDGTTNIFDNVTLTMASGTSTVGKIKYCAKKYCDVTLDDFVISKVTETAGE